MGTSPRTRVRGRLSAPRSQGALSERDDRVPCSATTISFRRFHGGCGHPTPPSNPRETAPSNINCLWCYRPATKQPPAALLVCRPPTSSLPSARN
eukprot:2777672-Alexandrium_andersonii.AAC.1